MVYKLVELDGAGRVKLSPGKKTYPLAKQIFRTYDDEGRFLKATRSDSARYLSRCRQWRDIALEQAVTLADYLRTAA